MYKITLKLKEPLFLEDDVALQIKTKWIDKKVSGDFIFDVHGTSFPKRSILYIDLQKSSQESNSTVSDAIKVDREEYNHWKDKTPQEKAERLGAFLTCYKMVNADEPKPELLEMLKSHLIKFFESNPKRTYADYQIYIKFIVPKGKQKQLTLGQSTMISIFARTLANDYQNSKFTK